MAADTDKIAWVFSFPSIDGGTLDLAAFKGRVLLVANTASFCGYTYQYEGLEKLYAAKSSAGLTVIGVPSQDFNQESADNATVKTFCETRFDIDFPAGRHLPCQGRPGRAVLRLGCRREAVAAGVELQ